jgi:two-component system chemotaxis response regulator CheB
MPGEVHMAKRDIVVIGGSAGGTAALKLLVQGLPAEFPGTLFVTTHMASQQPSYLCDILGPLAKLPVVRATDGLPIEPGRIYLATPDRHLLLMGTTLRLGAGPRENMSRPAIDPMFRSAVMSYGSRVVGVILSGLLDDGVSGLRAVHDARGVTVVQHPLDAAEPDMPRAALETVPADHVVPASDMARLLLQIVQTEAADPAPVPRELAFEVDVAAGARLGSTALRRIADPVALTCPDCQGVLSEIRTQKPLRYRCQTGHAYTAEQLVAKHELVDEAMRIALRMMEERLELIERMARDARETGRRAVAELYEDRAGEYRRYAETLRAAALATAELSAEVASAERSTLPAGLTRAQRG